jgi:predicted Ser/Thr protein kinase/putative methionine-R-sulfoxide reductase with GAF domain
MLRDSERPTGDADQTLPSSRRDRPLSPGDVLGGRYRIESVLGYGGMGVVYRARDLKLDLEIALKSLRPDKISPERRETLRREIILSRKVTHESVCRVYDLVEMNGMEFVSMEYVPGRTLKEIEEKEGVLPLGRGLSIAKGICRGLAAAHRIGVLHRDLKPENVMIDQEGKPRLMDFGIAIESAQWKQEKSGTVPGTPQFLAPELLRGAPPDEKTDVYAMGVLLYEMFTGRVPFDDDDTSVLVRKILSEKAPRLETLRPDLPRELTDILERAIARDPAARFGAAEELASAIEQYEGLVLDRALREVSVARARSVKLMVILEANKALMGTFDPTEILRIILKTATSETGAERGTIFLIDQANRELVSQILAGGTIGEIRVPWGQGIAGACAATGEPITTSNAYQDSRFDGRTDSSSGFKTASILAAPMKSPAGEVVGVIEILNKRREQAFNKEDEEFLMDVASHAAVAVLAQRHYESSLAEEQRLFVERLIGSIRPKLTPAEWPLTPGFESGPLRWSGKSPTLIGYAVHAAPGLVSSLLAESRALLEDGLGPFAFSFAEARSVLSAEDPVKVLQKFAGQPVRALAARASTERVELAALAAELPRVFRGDHPIAVRSKASGDIRFGDVAIGRGDLLLLASSGLDALGGAEAAELDLEIARTTRGRPLTGALLDLVGEWKGRGLAPDRDVIVLAVRQSVTKR